MKSKEYVLEQLKSIKPDLVSRYPIASIALFGSLVRGDHNEKSDIDILVEFNGKIGTGFFEIAHELEDFLENKVDLVSRKAVKTKYFDVIKADLIYV